MINRTLLLILMVWCGAFNVYGNYKSLVLSYSPYQYLPMDDTSGTVIKDACNHKNGAYWNCVLKKTGIDDSSYSVYMPGSSSGIAAYSDTSVISSSAGSVMLWVKSDTIPWGGVGNSGLAVIMDVHSDNSNLLQIATYNTGLGVRINWRHKGTEDTVSIPTSRVGFTKWICLIATYDSINNRSVFYFNGSQLGKVYPFAGITRVVATTTDLGLHTSGTYFWKGKMAHFAVWKRALADSEVVKLSYNAYKESAVYFGNSITYGYNATSETKKWVTIFSNLTGISVYYNAGISGTYFQNSGSATNNGFDRFRASVLAYNPRIVLNSYAINDMRSPLTYMTIDTFSAQMGRYIDTLKLSGISNKKIYWCNLPVQTRYDLPVSTNGGSLAKHLAYNDSIKKVCSIKKINFVDVYADMKARGDAAVLIDTDYVHPNDSGMHVIANSFYSAYLKANSTKKSTGNNKPQVSLDVGL